MMEQLLAHVWGDYILQTDRQAQLKRRKWNEAVLHAFTYTLVFMAITHSLAALAVIGVSHAIIDHYGLARYVVRLKNSLGWWSNRQSYATATGYPAESPPFMAIWLTIIADNVLHVTINYFAIRCL